MNPFTSFLNVLFLFFITLVIAVTIGALSMLAAGTIGNNAIGITHEGFLGVFVPTSVISIALIWIALMLLPSGRELIMWFIIWQPGTGDASGVVNSAIKKRKSAEEQKKPKPKFDTTTGERIPGT